jgi:hypothetical protein
MFCYNFIPALKFWMMRLTEKKMYTLTPAPSIIRIEWERRAKNTRSFLYQLFHYIIRGRHERKENVHNRDAWPETRTQKPTTERLIKKKTSFIFLKFKIFEKQFFFQIHRTYQRVVSCRVLLIPHNFVLCSAIQSLFEKEKIFHSKKNN